MKKPEHSATLSLEEISFSRKRVRMLEGLQNKYWGDLRDRGVERDNARGHPSSEGLKW